MSDMYETSVTEACKGAKTTNTKKRSCFDCMHLRSIEEEYPTATVAMNKPWLYCAARPGVNRLKGWPWSASKCQEFDGGHRWSALLLGAAIAALFVLAIILVAVLGWIDTPRYLK